MRFAPRMFIHPRVGGFQTKPLMPVGCADCGQYTLFRCDLPPLHWSAGTYLYGNHPVNRRHCVTIYRTMNGEFEHGGLTALCLTCRRLSLLCHRCRGIPWCTPPSWTRQIHPAPRHFILYPPGSSEEEEPSSDDDVYLSAEMSLGAAGMSAGLSIRTGRRLVRDYRYSNSVSSSGCRTQ